MPTKSDICAELRVEIDSLSSIERDLDLELEVLMQDSTLTDSETAFNAMNIPALIVQSNSTCKLIHSSSILAERLSRQVRQLDLEQSNVKRTLDLLEIVEDIKVVKALTYKTSADVTIAQLEEASACIQKYLAQDHDQLSRIFTHEMYLSTGSTNPLESLKANVGEVLSLIVDRFETAIQTVNASDIKRLVSLFPLIGEDMTGIDRFSSFLCSTLSRHCQDLMRTAESQLHASSTTLVFLDIFSRLFEMVADVINKQTPFLSKHFGPGKIIRLIQRLQRESDVQSCIFVDTLLDKKGVQRMLNEIRDKQDVDARAVDLILNEVALISGKVQLFEGFIAKRAKSEVEALVDEEFKEKTLALYKHNMSGMPVTSRIQTRIETVLLHYVKLENYFVHTSIEKAKRSAIKGDYYEDGMFASSSVEDIFFVLQNITSRAIASNGIKCFTSVFTLVARTLEKDVLPFAQRKISAAFTPTEIKENRQSAYVAVNTIERICRYLDKLVGDSRGMVEALDVQTQFSVQSQPAQIDIAFTLLVKVKSTLEAMLKSCVETTFTHFVKPRIRQILQESLSGVTYNFKSSTPSTLSARIQEALSKLLSSFAIKFTHPNATLLHMKTLNHLTAHLDTHISTLTFTQPGALQFDKDVRAITRIFLDTSSPDQSTLVREALQKLSCIARILTCETSDEVEEISEEFVGVLSAEDVKKIWALKT